MKILKKLLIIFIAITILFFQTRISVFADNTVQNSENTSENTVSDENSVNNSVTNEQEDDSSNKIDDLNAQKEDLEALVNAKQTQMGIVEDQISEALAEVESLSLRISEKKAEIENIEAEEISLMSYIEEAEKSLAEYTEKYEKEKALLEQRLVAMYEMGEIKYLDVLLNSESLSDFLSRYYLVSEITESDFELVSSVKDSKTQMESLTESLKEKKEELEQDKIDKEKYQISLSNMEILKNNKLNALNAEELAIYQEVENYKNEIESIESEIRMLALNNIGDTYVGGNMIWPTPGYTTITSNFGMRTHPITGIYKLHTGVDIGAPYGSTFVAANSGVVIKAEMNSAYGNMVIIDHGGGVVTLYAHGSEILVEVGQTVTQGTAVLKVGSTGYSTGPHAHFEIRINGEYVNPLDYISPDNKANSNQESTENTGNEVIRVELGN